MSVRQWVSSSFLERPILTCVLAGAFLGVFVIHTTAAFAMGPGALGQIGPTLRGAFSVAALPLLVYHMVMGIIVGCGAGIVATRAYRLRLAEEKRATALEGQLARAQKLESVGRLAAGVAHDFNNVLTALRMSLFLAKGAAAKGKDPSRFIEEAEKSVERGAHLPRQLLAFARRQPSDPVVVDVAEVVGDLEKMMARLLGEDIALETDLDPACVRIDPGQLEQVLVNLAVNARDAMPAGGRLAIATRVVPVASAEAPALGVKQGSYVRISVRDTGTGMSDEVLRKIFEPFFTTKPEGKGTGLGLATAFGIVAQAGGAVRVDSELGKGSTFHVHLPKVDEPPAPRKGAAAPAEATRTRLQVLVVDDQPPVRAGIAGALRAMGYKVVDASTTQEALAHLEDAKKEGGRLVLVTDVVMPGLAGPGLATLARSVLPDVRVVFMTGHAEGGLPEEWATSPLLMKPFEPAALAEVVEKVAR